MIRTVDRILATSDLHGQSRKFKGLLIKADYDAKKDLLVVCGDLIDRGKENLDCLAACAKLQKQGAIFLKGNHEQFLEQSLKEMLASDMWRTRPSECLYNWFTYNGGAEMYDEIKDLSAAKLLQILKFIQSLPLYYSINNYIFTHAGANTRKPINENKEDETVWMEERFPYCPAYKGKILIFGHKPTWELYPYNSKCKKKDAKIWFDTVNKDKIGIDCGGIFGGRLAALELPTYKELYV